MNEILTKPLLTKEMLTRFIRFEGICNHMYLDGPGNVTIGIGCMLADASSASRLPFMHKQDNLLATTQEIIDEYKTIKNTVPAQVPEHYGAFTKLYLADSDIHRLFEFRLNDINDTLKKVLSEFKKIDPMAREVLLDMAFNLGVSGLLNKFPKFMKAIKENNYYEAARESARKGVQPERNLWAFITLMEIT